jgi:hypothetical protein
MIWHVGLWCCHLLLVPFFYDTRVCRFCISVCTGTCKFTTAWLLEAKNRSKDRERDKDTMVGADGEGDCASSSSSLLEALSHDCIEMQHAKNTFDLERLSVSPSTSRYVCT